MSRNIKHLNRSDRPQHIGTMKQEFPSHYHHMCQ